MGWVILIIIGIVIVWTIIKFASDSTGQANAVTKQGGMRMKYKTLISLILSECPEMDIVQETATFINIGYSSAKGSMAFFITQTFGKVTIQWKVKTPLYGKHSLEWTFSENLDQTIMTNRIIDDIENYTDKYFNKFM